MRSFEDLPIKRKLTLLIMLTSLTAVLLACAGFAIYELVTFRRSMVSDLTTLADIVGATSTAALSFEDTKAATEFLAALKTKPHIVAACFYTKCNHFFADTLARVERQSVRQSQARRVIALRRDTCCSIAPSSRKAPALARSTSSPTCRR